MPDKEWGDSIGPDQSVSVQKILDGALRAIASRGARRLSMSDISESSGVSRGTLYRYFASKDDVLSALSEYVCSSFERGIVEAASGFSDPIARFRAVMQFYGRFTIERSPDGLFEVEPAFHLDFLRTHFDRHKAAVQKALEPVLDYLETLTSSSFDRDLFCDTLVRLQLSTLIIPASPAWLQIWNDAPDQLCRWALRIAGKHVDQERMN